MLDNICETLGAELTVINIFSFLKIKIRYIYLTINMYLCNHQTPLVIFSKLYKNIEFM